MPDRGRCGKPTAGFPQRPPPLEIATRFPHSHRPDDGLPWFDSDQRQGLGGGSLRSRRRG